jgi:hypothetical protein
MEYFGRNRKEEKMSNELIYGASKIDRSVDDPERKLKKFIDTDDGYKYYRYHPITPKDYLYPEDIGITLVLNSRAGEKAVRSLIQHGKSIALNEFPQTKFEKTTLEEMVKCAEIIHNITKWPGFSASLATKTLHKKLPELIPILDNRAIFGAYLNPDWPKHAANGDSVDDFEKIKRALEYIHSDITREENKAIWPALKVLAPDRSLIEIFDMIWWIHFQENDPKKDFPD